MHATAATPGRWRTQVLKVFGILAQAADADVEHGDELHEGVVGHLAHAWYVRMFGPKLHHKLAGAVVHVAVAAIHVAANDIEKVCIRAVPGDHLINPSHHPVAP